jgi:signal transduction histidine kinase
MRLLTYRTDSDQGPAIIQAGRLLSDQDRVLTQYLTGLLLLGGASVVLLGLGSWWLSGRSLGPTQRAWDQQQAFVSNASHELRTPLTLIKATAEVGLRAHPAPEQRQTLLEVMKEVDYMSRLVDDLLLLSRLDSHRLHLEHTPVDVHPLLADACQQADKLSAEKGVQIRLEPSQGAVLADPVRMRQVLLILLDNALRFTPTGGRISLSAQPHGKWQVIIVSDNGRGIPAKDLPHVFQRFYQASRPGEETAGNGLGLSIARGLVEAQGGKIAIESREGAGTRVLISLPAVR